MLRKSLSVSACMTAAICMLSFFGCSESKPDTATVRGKVTYQGKPVTTGRIVFNPVDGRRPAMASINEDGTFELTTFPGKSKDGAMLGEHIVTVKSTRTVGGEMPDEFSKEAKAAPAVMPKLEWLVPQKYSRKDTSPLKETVTEGQNEINIDIEPPAK